MNLRPLRPERRTTVRCRVVEHGPWRSEHGSGASGPSGAVRWAWVCSFFCSRVSCLLRRGVTGTHGHCYLGALPTPRTGLDPREEGRSRRGREPESGYLRDRWHTQPGEVAEGGVERPPLVVQGLTYSPLCYNKGVSSSTRHGSTRMELHPRLGLTRPAAGPAGRWLIGA